MLDVTEIGKRAKKAARDAAKLSTAQKNDLLCAISAALRENAEQILSENQKDIDAAAQNGVRDNMIDRLRLTKERLSDIGTALEKLCTLCDPVGQIMKEDIRPNGLKVSLTRVPLGVVGIIYEARPNVTVDCAALCLKSGNAVILRGGKEAIHSNIALANVMRQALLAKGANPDMIQLIEDTDRASATRLMTLRGYVDVLIPRGGKGLIRSVCENATVPTIETGAGNCHIYVEDTADIDMAVRILDNAKTSRPSVCNAAETLLVGKKIASAFLPKAKAALDAHDVEWRGCEKTRAILPGISAASEEDYDTEYNDYILAVKVVEDFEEALEHICTYSTGHSEAIVTTDKTLSARFLAEVDSAAVYVNASTRFTDGGEFGLGAEIGISTQKLHARGPMGLEALTSVKFIIEGEGQVR